VIDPADSARAEGLAARLRAMPAHLAQARRNLTTDTPRLWAEMGAAGARGLERFVAHSVAGYGRGLPAALAADASRASLDAALALTGVASFAEELVERARGEWACGAEQFDYLLHTYHHLELDSAELAELGRDRLDRESTALKALAASRYRDTDWRQQIGGIKDQHPEPERFLDNLRRRDGARPAAHAAGGAGDRPGERGLRDGVGPEYRRDRRAAAGASCTIMPSNAERTVPPCWGIDSANCACTTA
jgi:hypothetical protein